MENRGANLRELKTQKPSLLKVIFEKTIQVRPIKRAIKKSFIYGLLNPFRDRVERGEGIQKHRLKKFLGKQNPVILEIGANDGGDSLAFLQMFKGIKLYCFEPHPIAMNKLQKRLNKDFRGNKDNYELVELALSNKNGKIKFYVSDADTDLTQSSIKKPKNILKEKWNPCKYEKSMEVKTKKLDGWVEENKIGKIDLIWADVEGAERELIFGGLKTLNENVRWFYTEYSDDEYFEGQPTLKEILGMLPNFSVVGIYGNNVLLRNKRLR